MTTPPPATPTLRELLDAPSPTPRTEVTLHLAQGVVITVKVGSAPHLPAP